MKRLKSVAEDMSIVNKAFSKSNIAYDQLKKAFEIMEFAFKEDLQEMLNDKDITTEEASLLAVAADEDIREFFNFTLFGRE